MHVCAVYIAIVYYDVKSRGIFFIFDDGTPFPKKSRKLTFNEDDGVEVASLETESVDGWSDRMSLGLRIQMEAEDGLEKMDRVTLEI